MTNRVVSNTSPLTNLAAIGHLDLLPGLFGRIEIPDAVWNELNSEGKSWPGQAEVAAASWVGRHTPRNRSLIRALRRDLDAGESESIALAIELEAALVLLDEREGRRAAQDQGLKPMGVVGILLLAKRRGLITAVKPSLNALRNAAGFWLDEDVYDLALENAQESR